MNERQLIARVLLKFIHSNRCGGNFISTITTRKEGEIMFDSHKDFFSSAMKLIPPLGQ
jgi:hypothetical protein